ncbi:unnamed protein product [Rotaria socialis]|uniref:Uncharacterized protein n=1 Tax=Rotaria socialis TaxID=392032 RepID=A0A818A8F4_9BILA|nr:unnamed protein product [Rotaria socialis]CAF4288907.1 unnamed protein product [Rotaria socialis]CAF4702640.1 unnamed protein product [Rotaria socialis]
MNNQNLSTSTVNDPAATITTLTSSVISKMKKGEVLKVDLVDCNCSLMPISYNGIDPLFMYTQLFKEALLKIEDDDTQSIKEFADFCRLQK